MPGFVRHDIVIEAERLRTTHSVRLETRLQEAGPGLGIRPTHNRDELQPRMGIGVQPDDRAAQIVFPDVEGPADGAVEMCGEKLFRLHRDMIEMSVRSRQGRGINRTTIGRDIMRWIVGLVLSHRVDHAHRVIGWTRAHGAGRQRHFHHLGLRKAFGVTGIQTETRAADGRGPHFGILLNR